ncbi:MAG: hypothetical protein A2945_01985 [Candidatus Liptonbacteria bacterium RIFCSPLOWO2_01_FULL_52_25]|uniref:Sugar kinase n=1 Tax=Candidatus Liptonbacteria bacterium RIFCSPLOWO2_01_FULL_52_25 TaxID=1798650 RepID=A0A1G2CEU0_9BACT|nr:MAG: hypothetical protein A2945_01985 [Candidatus Liptonbacteria bacterium RIFCSPLOWO2_01_FULL_52_25]
MIGGLQVLLKLATLLLVCVEKRTQGERMRVVGVDLGRKNIRSAVVNERGTISGEDRRLTLSDRSAEQIVGDIVGSIIIAANKAGIQPADCAAIGIGAPGPLDPIRRTLLDVPNWKTFQNVRLGDEIEERLGIRTEIANDVDCFTLGEYAFGAGRNFRGKTVFGAAIGSGFGSGLVHEGKLFRGMGMAPEMPGHTDIWGLPSVADIDLCSCGQRGHAEAVLSGYGLPRLARFRGLEDVATAEDFQHKLDEGSELAGVVVGEVGRYLGRAFVNVVHAYHPQVIIVGGSVAKLGKPMLSEAYHVLKATGFKSMTAGTLIIPAELGDDAGMLGAAKLALDLVKGGAR